MNSVPRGRANGEAVFALCIPGPSGGPDPPRAPRQGELSILGSLFFGKELVPPLLPLRQLSPMCCRMMGLGPSSVSPQSLQRQPHTISLVLPAFKLPFYLNLCLEIQAEKGPFQSQCLLYVLYGDCGQQLSEISSAPTWRRGTWAHEWLFQEGICLLAG